MLGMHGEEVLARFAALDARMPMCQLDVLRYFFYDLGNVCERVGSADVRVSVGRADRFPVYGH